MTYMQLHALLGFVIVCLVCSISVCRSEECLPFLKRHSFSPGATDAAAVLHGLAGAVPPADDLHASVARRCCQHGDPGRHLQHLPALRVQVPVVLQHSKLHSNSNSKLFFCSHTQNTAAERSHNAIIVQVQKGLLFIAFSWGIACLVATTGHSMAVGLLPVRFLVIRHLLSCSTGFQACFMQRSQP